MKKLGEFVKKHKKLVIFLLIVVVIAGGVVFINIRAQKALTELMNSMKGSVAEVERQALVESLSATGNITSLETTNITANVANVEILEVNVEVGDAVHAGDILAVFDSSNLEMNLNSAETTMGVAKAKSGINVASSARGLSEAQENEAVQISRDYEDAQKAYDKYMDALKEVDEAQAQYDSAVNVYNARQKEYDEYKENNPDAASDMSTTSMFGLGGLNFSQGAQYLTNLTSAENDKNAKKQALDAKKTAADNALTSYKQVIRTYEDHVRNDDSAIMTRNDSLNNARLDATTATLSTEIQRKQYQDQVDACVVKAPYDGVVTAVNVYEGNMYTGTPILTLQDISGLEITSEIDEYDIAKVKVGQKVIFKTNGTGDEEFEGVIKSIAPTATTSQVAQAASNVTYKVKTTILNPSKDFKLDMTAKMSIILDEKDDVLTVPYDAVQTDDEGKFYIELANDNDLGLSKDNSLKENATGLTTDRERVYITRGIASDFYIEIAGEGISEGMKIYVPEVDSGKDFLTLMMEQGAMGGF